MYFSGSFSFLLIPNSATYIVGVLRHVICKLDDAVAALAHLSHQLVLVELHVVVPMLGRGLFCHLERLPPHPAVKEMVR